MNRLVQGLASLVVLFASSVAVAQEQPARKIVSRLTGQQLHQFIVLMLVIFL